MTSPTNKTRGILYIASREPYLEEAAQSARSVRQHHPDMAITLYAPETVDPPGVFDDVQSIKNPSHDFSDSNLSSEHMPYDRNLFLDSDTYVCGSLESVFDLLDRYDLAAAHDPTREGTAGHTHEHNVPESYPQFNTGVVAYRDTEAVGRLFDRWNELYHTVDGVAHGLNQPTFRMATYNSNLDIGTLPSEYNFRLGNVANSVNYASGEIKIIHGRSFWWDAEELAGRINATTERRVVVAKPRPVEIHVDGDRSLPQRAAYAVDRAHWKVVKDGMGGLVRGVGSVVKGAIGP